MQGEIYDRVFVLISIDGHTLAPLSCPHPRSRCCCRCCCRCALLLFNAEGEHSIDKGLCQVATPLASRGTSMRWCVPLRTSTPPTPAIFHV